MAKVKELVTGTPVKTNVEIEKITAINNSTIEVMFTAAVANINKEDFKFDNDLIVNDAVLSDIYQSRSSQGVEGERADVKRLD